MIKNGQDCNNCGSIFVIERTLPVFWAHISVLEGDLVCLNELYKRNSGNPRSKWRVCVSLEVENT